MNISLFTRHWSFQYGRHPVTLQSAAPARMLHDDVQPLQPHPSSPAARSYDLFPTLSTPTGNISLHESHFWQRSSIERGRPCGPTHGPALWSLDGGGPNGPRRRRLSGSTLSNRPCADRYAVEMGAKDALAARKIRRF